MLIIPVSAHRGTSARAWKHMPPHRNWTVDALRATAQPCPHHCPGKQDTHLCTGHNSSTGLQGQRAKCCCLLFTQGPAPPPGGWKGMMDMARLSQIATQLGAKAGPRGKRRSRLVELQHHSGKLKIYRCAQGNPPLG